MSISPATRRRIRREAYLGLALLGMAATLPGNTLLLFAGLPIGGALFEAGFFVYGRLHNDRAAHHDPNRIEAGKREMLSPRAVKTPSALVRPLQQNRLIVLLCCAGVLVAGGRATAHVLHYHNTPRVSMARFSQEYDGQSPVVLQGRLLMDQRYTEERKSRGRALKRSFCIIPFVAENWRRGDPFQVAIYLEQDRYEMIAWQKQHGTAEATEIWCRPGVLPEGKPATWFPELRAAEPLAIFAAMTRHPTTASTGWKIGFLALPLVPAAGMIIWVLSLPSTPRVVMREFPRAYQGQEVVLLEGRLLLDHFFVETYEASWGGGSLPTCKYWVPLVADNWQPGQAVHAVVYLTLGPPGRRDPIAARLKQKAAEEIWCRSCSGPEGEAAAWFPGLRLAEPLYFFEPLERAYRKY